MQAVTDKWGRLDILINAAAGNFLAPAEVLTPKGFKTGESERTSLCKVQSSSFGWTQAGKHDEVKMGRACGREGRVRAGGVGGQTGDLAQEML